MSKTTLVLGALLMGATANVQSAEPSKKFDPTKMTCAEFIAVEADVQPRVVAWLDGYSKAGKEVAAPVAVQREVALVKAACVETPKQSLWEKIRAKLPGGKKTVPDPTKMTCEEFVALDKAAQPEIAYWLDGYSAGSSGADAERMGAKPVGAIAFDREVLVVIDACREAPKQSLWERIKKKF